jgi:hypothetical protein
MQRLLTDEEAAAARAVLNWTFWAPPAIFAVAGIVAVFFLIGADMIAWAIFAPFIVVTAVMWFSRLRRYSKIIADINNGIVEVIAGAPEKVWMSRSGTCYVRLGGQNVVVPNDRCNELREANSIKVALLPTTGIAVHIEAARGMGLS